MVIPLSDSSSEESSEPESSVVPDSTSDSDDCTGGADSGFISALFETTLVDDINDLAMDTLEAGVPFEGSVFGVDAGLLEDDFGFWSENLISQKKIPSF